VAAATASHFLSRPNSRNDQEEVRIIVSILVLPVFLFSFPAAARLSRMSWRNATISLALNATVGLAIFSALTTILQLSVQRISELPPEIEVTMAPLVFVIELLTGTYVASKILSQDFLRLLKFIPVTFSITGAILIPLLFLVLK
jgi:hypothetical protein